MTLPKSTETPSSRALRERARQLRRLILDVSHATSKGHLGSALSVADIMAALWGVVMNQPGTDSPERDRFVLGKGHAALALHASLYQAGILSRAQLDSYCQEGSDICAHPMHRVPGIDVSTGSLGQGLSVACGQALALRRAQCSARVFVLMSDGECNEGQVWEAAMFAGHHRLDNLHVVVDLNGSQCMGASRDIIALDDPAAPWRAFGWEVAECSGHDLAELSSVLGQPGKHAPVVFLATTVIGKGVSFMEHDFEWHYRVMTNEQHAAALAELSAT